MLIYDPLSAFCGKKVASSPFLFLPKKTYVTFSISDLALNKTLKNNLRFWMTDLFWTTCFPEI